MKRHDLVKTQIVSSKEVDPRMEVLKSNCPGARWCAMIGKGWPVDDLPVRFI